MVTPPPGFSLPARKSSPDSQETTRVEPSYYDSKLPKPAARTGQSSQTGLVLSSQAGYTGKQKQKFVPLMSAEGQSRVIMQLPGRHTCHCLAQKHALVNNCIECGRIVCTQVCVCICTLSSFVWEPLCHLLGLQCNSGWVLSVCLH